LSSLGNRSEYPLPMFALRFCGVSRRCPVSKVVAWAFFLFSKLFRPLRKFSASKQILMTPSLNRNFGPCLSNFPTNGPHSTFSSKRPALFPPSSSPPGNNFGRPSRPYLLCFLERFSLLIFAARIGGLHWPERGHISSTLSFLIPLAGRAIRFARPTSQKIGFGRHM